MQTVDTDDLVQGCVEAERNRQKRISRLNRVLEWLRSGRGDAFRGCHAGHIGQTQDLTHLQSVRSQKIHHPNPLDIGAEFLRNCGERIPRPDFVGNRCRLRRVFRCRQGRFSHCWLRCIRLHNNRILWLRSQGVAYLLGKPLAGTCGEQENYRQCQNGASYPP